ncbi:MAG: PIG-L deacetylase family protein [Anaerotruncus rubiinfantis]|jgi:4-oxalomesaconate hydratase|uniref:PIG-L deacetylase family protein n=1 Tax=Anaerotruncus rubiinfantis TaxID=1720200 RepID=UPI001896FC69|nr:PIG-L family deacetylase [Anaerotruncus rubiinfantis]
MGKKDMLVVSAHAADYCTRAGGTIARYVREGWKVHILVLTYGSRGESGDYWRNTTGGTVEECSKIRHRESQAAADFLGAEIEFYGYNDYPLTMDEERIRLLTKRILEIRPELILTHWISDPLNLDHEITGKAVVRALSSAAQIGAFPDTPAHYFPNVYFFESTVPHSEFNGFCADTYIEIDDVYDTKMQAVAKFACQPHLGNYYTHFATHRGFQAKDWAKRDLKYAEGFKRYLPYVGTQFPLIER